MRKPEDTGKHWAEASASTEAEDWDEIDVSDQLEAVDHEEAEDHEVAAGPVAVPFELVDPASRAATGDAPAAPLRGAQPKPNPEGVRMSSETRPMKQTVVEVGSDFKGTLTSSYAVLVNGTIDGQVQAPVLSVANTGALRGTIKTKVLRSQGTLAASVDADEVFLSGAIRSKTVIKTRRLEMKLTSPNDSRLEVHFAAAVLEASDVSRERDNAGAPTSGAGHDSDSLTSGGWPSAAVPGDVLDAAAAADTSARSPSKSSRRSEIPGSTTKRR